MGNRGIRQLSISHIERIGDIDTIVSGDEYESIGQESREGEQRRMENQKRDEGLMDYDPSSPNETMGYNPSSFREISTFEEKDENRIEQSIDDYESKEQERN